MGPGDSGNPSHSKEPAPFALVGLLFCEDRGQPPHPPSGRPRPAILDPQPRAQLTQEQGRQRHSLGETANQLRAHGSKVVAAVGDAVKSIDNVASALSKLSELHAYVLRVDPVNFKFLSHCLLVTLSSHFLADFTAHAHAAWDKFLSILSGVLTEKYR
ncbi:hemoglobin subunit zeta-like [Cervus elaphus]|uniref:hemoglobin subunit zeta-like n=1 Tax=Cervus elaphus TaxID=9860 RepID=UPI001CC2835E|nr:hemoglobin subunit zeta-like [Cervus elaphus]